MRAFLIDPEARTLETIDYIGGLHQLYEVIGCDAVATSHFGDASGDVAYVDDEGLLKGPTHFFLIEGMTQPLAGKSVIVGTDAEGNDIEPTVTEEWLRENLDFGHPMMIGTQLMFMGDRNRRMIA